MSSKPQLVAGIQIPTVLSFTSGPDPQLKLRLTLMDATRPITISKDINALFTAANAFEIYSLSSGEKIYDFFVDRYRCARSARTMPLDPEHADDFVTLEPGVPYEVHGLNFRPLGQERRSQSSTSSSQASSNDLAHKYRFLKLGMHLLEPGEEFQIRTRQGIEVHTWRWGSKEELMPCDWLAIKSDGEKLKVLSDEGCKVRVEQE